MVFVYSNILNWLDCIKSVWVIRPLRGGGDGLVFCGILEASFLFVGFNFNFLLLFPESPKSIQKRDTYGGGIGDPCVYLDAIISNKAYTIPGLIDEAKKQSEAELALLLAKKKSQGSSIVLASWGDILGDYIANDRTFGNLGDMSVIYNYGFLGFYGLGFGLPLLLGLPSGTLDCDSSDYLRAVQSYGILSGYSGHQLDHLVAAQGVDVARSLISEFDTFVRLEIGCITDREDTTEEANDVGWAISELVAALNARLDLIEAGQCQGRHGGYGNYHP